jgi:uncharacterized membrane protein
VGLHAALPLRFANTCGVMPVRWLAILLFALTSGNCFVDMANLERVYRICSIIGLGIALLVTSYIDQRARPRTN